MIIICLMTNVFNSLHNQHKWFVYGAHLAQGLLAIKMFRYLIFYSLLMQISTLLSVRHRVLVFNSIESEGCYAPVKSMKN